MTLSHQSACCCTACRTAATSRCCRAWCSAARTAAERRQHTPPSHACSASCHRPVEHSNGQGHSGVAGLVWVRTAVLRCERETAEAARLHVCAAERLPVPCLVSLDTLHSYFLSCRKQPTCLKPMKCARRVTDCCSSCSTGARNLSQNTASLGHHRGGGGGRSGVKVRHLPVRPKAWTRSLTGTLT
jgi:hypothetical protein